MDKPPWLRIKYRPSSVETHVREMAAKHGVGTVCHSAMCPNRNECWSSGTATFLILGNACTRNCRFCAIPKHPQPPKPDANEPERVANAVRDLGLNYAVITSVDRDDLPDAGASHFARTVKAVKETSPRTMVEVLIPDFGGSRAAMRKMVDAGPDVIGHNIETVRRLTPLIRDRRAGYERSLDVLRMAKAMDRRQITKSSIMVGLGEQMGEVMAALRHLRRAGTDIVTIGQYLRPTERHVRVEEYVHPETFELYEREAWRLGFKYVASGPFVRSSYKAAEAFVRTMGWRR